jgi:hypothetical protein
MKNLAHKILAVQIGVLLTTGAAVQAIPLYDNSTVDTGSSLNFVNGVTIGNEIKLGSGISSALVTGFSFEIFSTLAAFTSPNVQMQAFLYANNGAPFNGYPTPGTALYSSGLFSLQTPQQYSGINAVTLNFNGLNVAVGNDFTLAVVVTGLASGDTVGMELFDPATVGQNFGDYWLNNNGGGWSLLSTGSRTDFGARIEGTPTPDAASTAGLLGLGLSSLCLLRRKFCAEVN